MTKSGEPSYNIVADATVVTATKLLCRVAAKEEEDMTDLIKNTGQLWRCGNLYRTARYDTLGIGSYQDSYIVNVCAHPGITQEALSKLIFVHKSNVARQLGSLEEKGYVTRKTDDNDKRNLLVYPTARAFEALREIERVNDEWDSLVLGGLTNEERKAAEKLIGKLAENAGRLIEKEYKKEAETK